MEILKETKEYKDWVENPDNMLYIERYKDRIKEHLEENYNLEESFGKGSDSLYVTGIDIDDTDEEIEVRFSDHSDRHFYGNRVNLPYTFTDYDFLIIAISDLKKYVQL
jgi:hypothetical protein